MARNRRSRYIGIFRGGRAEEINRLIRYLRGEDMPNYPSRRGNRPEQLKNYARPFLEGVGTNFYLEASVNNNRWGIISGAIGSRVKTTLSNTETGIKIPNFYNPRAVFTWGISRTGTSRNSQITGRNYRDYGGESAVSQFGKVGNTDTPSDEFQEIRNAFRTTQGGQTDSTRRVVYIPPSY